MLLKCHGSDARREKLSEKAQRSNDDTKVEKHRVRRTQCLVELWAEGERRLQHGSWVSGLDS